MRPPAPWPPTARATPTTGPCSATPPGGPLPAGSAAPPTSTAPRRPTAGWLGGALDFDGRDDCIRVDRPRGFNFAPESFSVSAWINAREARGRWHAILEYDRTGFVGNRFGLWLRP